MQAMKSILCSLTLLFSLTTCCFSSETMVAIQTKAGRTYRGAIDARTNGIELWLRMSHGTAHLQRPIAWSDITNIEYNSNTITLPELQQLADTSASPMLRAKHRVQPSNSLATWGHVPNTKSLTIGNVEIDCYLANWNADALDDGLQLILTAYNANGERIPLRGTLQAELIGTGYGQRYTHATPRTTVSLARWSRDLSSNKTLQLEFPPELRGGGQGLSPYATLHIQLMIPGEAVIHRTLSGVRIRPYSW
jgi:hypothetical protein